VTNFLPREAKITQENGASDLALVSLSRSRQFSRRCGGH